MGSIFNDIGKFRFLNEFGGHRFYVPTDIENGYHLSRFVQVQRQALYSSSGATPEVFKRCMDAILDLCNNNGEIKHRFTDIASIANMIKYRLDYPIDEHCSVRMGAILCFVEWDNGEGVVSENPDTFTQFFMDRKMDLALNNPDVYAFFLTLGVSNTPTYREHLNILEDNDYFQKRNQVLKTLARIV